MAFISKVLFTLCCGIAPFFCTAQSVVYTFQKDDTLLKRNLYNAAEVKNKTLTASLGKDNLKDYKKAYESQLAMVKDLLLTTRSVTEEKAYTYINNVVKRIVDANPSLKGLDTRIVFSRDLWPNAYSIGDGTIAFNAGLFVFLQNEAEMAFVLSHELAHYYLDHSGKKIRKYVERVNSDDFKKEIKRLEKQEYQVMAQYEKLVKTIAFDIRRHSRDNEAEADRVGLRFLKNAGYNGQAFITTMELLDKVDDTSFLKAPDLKKLFSFPGYPFRDKWIKKESAIFGAMNPEDESALAKKERDSLKTHPDCSKRIELLKDSAVLIKGNDFLVDQQTFSKLKEDFLAEIIEECFAAGNISRNLYFNLQLLQEGKNTTMAIYSIARDLNLLYQQQKDHTLGLSVDSENRQYPESYNLLLRMLYRIRLEEIADLAYYFCTAYSEQMKDYAAFAAEWNKAKQHKQP
ncbi:MAG: M48 family metallopeptidase [Bacteroidetes bacterium]|nr:M48 family metallopeptidase [Bacteroidota bacterium]